MAEPPPKTHDYRVKLTIFWVIVVAFLIAMPFMFVHPGVVIFLYWLGLVLIGAAAVIGWLIVRGREADARRSLRKHRCPHCHGEIDEDPEGSGTWHCHHCGANYQSSGIQEPTTTP